MATYKKRPSGGWKASVRRTGFPSVTKTWRTKRDAEVWATSVEDEMRRGLFIRREPSQKTTVSDALDRYLSEVVPTKRESTRRGNRSQAERLRGFLAATAWRPSHRTSWPLLKRYMHLRAQDLVGKLDALTK